MSASTAILLPVDGHRPPTSTKHEPWRQKWMCSTPTI